MSVEKLTLASIRGCPPRFFENALWVLTDGGPRVSIPERKTTSATEVVMLICSGNEVVREGFYWSA